MKFNASNASAMIVSAHAKRHQFVRAAGFVVPSLSTSHPAGQRRHAATAKTTTYQTTCNTIVLMRMLHMPRQRCGEVCVAHQ